MNTVEDALQFREIAEYIQDCLDDANLRAVNRVSKVKKWAILPQELDVLTGELTPTFKIKRKFINKKYEAKIEALYQEPKL